MNVDILLKLKQEIQTIEENYNSLKSEYSKKKKEWRKWSWKTSDSMTKLLKDKEKKIDELIYNIK